MSTSDIDPAVDAMRCRALWSSVLAQAVRDASAPSIRDHRGSSGAPAKHEMDEALAFLTWDRGWWAEARTELCSLLDLCPERLRKGVLRNVGAA